MYRVDIDCYLAKLTNDAAFRAKTASSLVTACFSAGFTLSNDEISYLNLIDFSQFSLVAEAVED